ncbi:MAG: molybdopterin-binding protein [Candidatus Nanopelagicales bacterium]
MSLEEHLGALLAQVGPLDPLDITLREAIGCQLVGDVAAPGPLPHYARAAISGYAARSADLATPAGLKVVDDVHPGFAAGQPVYAGVTVRLAAGSPLPTGADCVVPGPPAATGSTVELPGGAHPGDGITEVGAVAAEGQVVLRDGSVIGAAAVGLLALLGVVRVGVRPRPRVVVVTVGNELAPTGSPATPGLVNDAAGPLLVAAAEEVGAVPYRVGPIAYDDRDIHTAIDDQLIRADLLVIVGETGPTSRLRVQLDTLGSVSYDEGSTDLGVFGHGVVGDIEHIPVLVLPSEPVAAALLFAALAVPLIHTMRGVRGAPPVQVQVSAAIPRTAVTQLVPARREDAGVRPLLRPTLVDLTTADVLLRVLPGSGEQPAGASVPALPLRST